MPVVPLNLLALVLAAIVNMVIGFIWYSPAVFGTRWMKMSGIKMDKKMSGKDMMPMMLLGTGAALLMAYVLLHFSVYAELFYQQSMLSVSLTAAFFAWLGFIVPVHINSVLYYGHKWGVFAINAGYNLAALLAMAVVLSLLA